MLFMSIHCLLARNKIPKLIITGPFHLGPISLHHWSCRRTSRCLSSPGDCLAAARLTGMALEGRINLCEVVHGSELATKGAITVWVVSIIATESQCLPARRVVLRPWLSVVEADVVDAVALLLCGALLPTKELLCMAGDLHWRFGGDEVLRDVLPVTASIHAQATQEFPVVRYIGFNIY